MPTAQATKSGLGQWNDTRFLATTAYLFGISQTNKCQTDSQIAGDNARLFQLYTELRVYTAMFMRELMFMVYYRVM